MINDDIGENVRTLLGCSISWEKMMRINSTIEEQLERQQAKICKDKRTDCIWEKRKAGDDSGSRSKYRKDGDVLYRD